MTDKTKKSKPRKPNVGSDATKGARVFWWQIGLFAFALGTSAILIGITLVRLVEGRFTPGPAIAAVVVSGLSWGLVTSNDRAVVDPGGINVGSSEPELTAFMNRVADDVGAPHADAIYLVAEPRVTVTEETSYFGLKHDRRILIVGLPYLHGMTKAELAAVAAHHLGHYAESKIEHGVRGMRALRAAGDLVAIERDGFVNGVYGSYGRKMFRSVGGVGVAHEHAAERAAVDAYGTEAMMSGLHKLDDLAIAWDQMLRDYVVPALQAKVHPQDLFSGFEELLKSPTRTSARADDVAKRITQEGSEFDPHNTPGERSEIIASWPSVAAGVELDDADGPASSLVDGAAKSTEIVVGKWAHALIDTRTEPKPWKVLTDDVYAPNTHSLAASGDADLPADPGDRLDAVLAWTSADWEAHDESLAGVKALRRSEAFDRRHAWLTAVALEAAASVPSYEWQHNWDGPPALVSTDGTTFDPDPLVQLVLDGAAHQARQEFQALTVLTN